MFEINNHPGVRTKWTTTSLILESTACFDRSRPLISSDTSETLMIWSYNAGYDWSWWMLQLMITIDLFSLYVLFSHFRPRDGKFPPMREHPRVYVCRFNLTVYILNISWAIFILVSSLNIVNLTLSISFPWPILHKQVTYQLWYILFYKKVTYWIGDSNYNRLVS